MQTKKVTCVICPVGCEIEVDTDGTTVFEVRNNKCPRGYKYASAEVIHPERILTSTVNINGGIFPRLAVKSVKPVPKDKLFECMRYIRSVSVSAPVKMGDIIIKDIAGTGIDITAARDSQ